MHKKISDEFIRAMPKTDLHIHIDGSMRLGTLIELAKKNKVTLPSYTEEGLKNTVFKEHYGSLSECLEGFKYTCDVLQTKEALERVAYELALDSFGDGVRYIEPRFAPQLHTNETHSIEVVIDSVNRGFEKAKKEINQRRAIKDGIEPPFDYGLVCCALRMFNEHFSEYYKDFCRIHQYSSPEERYSLASLELAQAIVKIRDEKAVPIVGFDLAGAEKGFPAEIHRQAYQYAHKNFMKKTVHAGEAYGAASIFQAITDLYADRIGHGTYLFDEGKIDLACKKERTEYITKLAQYIAHRRITLEICLTSNTQTNPDLRDLARHPCKKMLEEGLSITFCTDNTLVSNTSSSNEFALAVENFGLDSDRLKNIVAYGFKRSFYPGSYAEKRCYVRQVLDYYEKLEKELL